MSYFVPSIDENEKFEFSEGTPPGIVESNLGGGSNRPKTPEKPLPGGPIADRPIQSTDGKWYKNFGQTQISEAQAREEEAKILAIRAKILQEANKPTSDSSQDESDKKSPIESADTTDDLDAQKLKSIFEKCVAKHEGKYSNGLLDINVTLDAADQEEMRKLLEKARQVHTGFTKDNPSWDAFIKLREDVRQVHGAFMEDSRIVEDASLLVPTLERVRDRAPIIRVPSNVYRLNIWESKIDGLSASFNEYAAGNSKGRMSEPLGRGTRDVYRFVKDSQAANSTNQAR